MSESDAEKWDRRYRIAVAQQVQPALVLSAYAHLLPAQGEALDLAAGLGGNALFLARLGFNATAWDISALAMQRLAEQAAAEGVALSCEVRDVVAEPPPAERFDVIVVSRFLERALCPAIAAALRPGGLLFYQTFTREKVDTGAGPSNPDFLLQRNELLRLFPELVVRLYREEGVLGDTTKGLRNEACLVAEKR
jgi:SAM-dependent methyltransferase